MSRRGLARHNARRDKAEPLVIDALKACGWSVQRISQAGWPDLFVWKWRGEDLHIRLVEVKTAKAKLKTTQRWWEGMLPVAILRTADEVIAWSQQQ